MRLSVAERDAIRSAVQKHFGANARVRLFGSRTDNEKRGGDIDLLVEYDPDGAELNVDRARIATIAEIQRRIGDQKVDLVASPVTGEDAREIVRRAKANSVPI